MVFYVDSQKSSSAEEIAFLLNKCILQYPGRWSELVFLCIGSDRVTGDCLGPYIGHQLLEHLNTDTADSVCYDVGAGTGSLSIEMALRAHQGQVWAIEKKEDAVELIHRNKLKFAADNLEIVEGLAPAALKDLPAPTHAFIGGSSGNLKEIVKLLLEKNPQVRIVINCITLETVSEALETAKEFGFEENEIVQLSAARSKAIGRYHMMLGENPIYIITLQNPGK